MVLLSAIQKQILLAKLIHEYKMAPDFGAEHISNYKSPQLQWVTRVHPLMKRVNLLAGINFESASRKMHRRNRWEDGVRETLMEVSKVISELKLDLELEGEDEIGSVYEANKGYDFFKKLKSILESTTSEIFIVDPYFNGKAFKNFFSDIKSPIKINVLSKGPLADEIVPYADKHTEQFSSVISVRKTKRTHDRVVFIDGSYGWIIGGSLNEGGKKPSYILPMPPALTPEKYRIYENIWTNSTIVL